MCARSLLDNIVRIHTMLEFNELQASIGYATITLESRKQ